MIFLFTDFGAADLYVGQVKAVLHQQARDVPVIDLLHAAPAFNVRATAHLLAALAQQIPPGSVMLVVVDPGVGGARDAVALNADGNWFVGPDNGLLSVLANRARTRSYWRITWRPEQLSASFHGRDLFAPIVAAIARGEYPDGKAEAIAGLGVDLGATDLDEIIYIDHYGNAFTGLRAQVVPRDARIIARGERLKHARVYSDVPTGEVFWYENSLGLVELAGNACSAAMKLGLQIGQRVAVETG
ncbi:MAG: SAM-dependent chlorinase/fluorinase [Betaproteobacteria bacterium]|nr:SAM-dependent chlorinase/fluorinase [Betaproteobacteria bacterium]